MATLINAATAATTGPAVDQRGGPAVPGRHTMQVIVAGTAPTALAVGLEGSLDGVAFHPLAADVTAVGGGLVTASGYVRSVRAVIRTLTLATGATDTAVTVLHQAGE